MTTLKNQLRRQALQAGFSAIGVAKCEPVDVEWVRCYDEWLQQGYAAGMEYLHNYPDLRSDAALLLPGARSVISLALNYYHAAEGSAEASLAMYAHGDDYHEVARAMMRPLTELLAAHGYGARICVDTAPVRERYWALKSGVAFAGRNGLAIVPEVGSFCFLCEIITDAPLEPDEPLGYQCRGCDRCVKACPGNAIMEGGRVDARRCHSYLSIEHRGEMPEGTELRMLYGCDVCQKVCPHNKDIPETIIKEFHLREGLRHLTVGEVEMMTQEQFSTLFRHSAVKRAKLAGLQRNLRYLRKPSS